MKSSQNGEPYLMTSGSVSDLLPELENCVSGTYCGNHSSRDTRRHQRWLGLCRVKCVRSIKIEIAWRLGW